MSALTRGRLAQAGTLAALGFFPMVAQTLLFRAFLGAVEGGELAVGCFFGSWLIWVGVGAAAARVETVWKSLLTRNFAWLPLLYLPAYILQESLIAHARALAGFYPYDVLPLGAMVCLSLLCNAPVCFLTGYLFALACGWLSAQSGLPVARAYVVETLGGFAGGITVTLLLVNAVPAQTVVLVAAALVAVTLIPHRPASWRHFAPTVVLIAVIAAGAGSHWADWEQRAAWDRLLPPQSYRGGFATAQGEYLYGERQGQFMVITSGGVREALPDIDRASVSAAVNLAQCPSASRVLVVGPGSLALCFRLTAFPTIKRVVWIDSDPALARHLVDVLPPRYRAMMNRIEAPTGDVTAFLRANRGKFDLALLDLPDPTSLVVNRYATREFLLHVKSALTNTGVLSLRVSGGANYLGSELTFLGASLLTTVKSVFDHVAIKPGEETWLIGSDGSGLSEAPAILRDRFTAIPGAANLYPPEGLLSQYAPDRTAFQMRAYQSAITVVPKSLLLNVANRPKALLYGLMLARRRGGEQAAAFLTPMLLENGFWIVVGAIAVFVVVRLVYLLKSSRSAPHATPWLFDSGFIVFSTGLAGMSLSVILMLHFQATFGALYLYVGLISSLFMLGGFLGSLLGERLLATRSAEPRTVLPACIALHLGALGVVAALPAANSMPVFAVLFVVAGGFTGIYFPLAAQRLAIARRAPTPAGSFLEALDTVGGAAGAAFTGLLLAPVLGSQATLGLLALLVSANLPALMGRRRTPITAPSADTFEQTTRPIGYALFGVAAVLMIASHVVAITTAEAEGPKLAAAARALTGRTDLKPTEARLPTGKNVVYYQAPPGANDTGGYVFPSGHLTGAIQGYGGPIELAIYVDPKGVLRNFSFLRSSETPAYVARLQHWRDSLRGINLFAPNPFAHVDAVSGATLTSAAVLRVLDQAGHRFAAEVLHRNVAVTTTPRHDLGPDRGFVAFALLALFALGLRYGPGRWRRRIFLVAVLAVLGCWLNLQYSTQQATSLLNLSWPAVALTTPFAVVLLVPILVALFGNVYCGYLCPFGALQELVGDLRPAAWDHSPDKSVWRYGRCVKYLLLFLLVALFAVYRDATVLSADPLITLFGSVRTGAIIVFAGALLIASVFYRRFWCRNLCPTGAFLSLVGALNLLKRFVPQVHPARCDMGVRTGVELDCLRCDRCRHE